MKKTVAILIILISLPLLSYAQCRICNVTVIPEVSCNRILAPSGYQTCDCVSNSDCLCSGECQSMGETTMIKDFDYFNSIIPETGLIVQLEGELDSELNTNFLSKFNRPVYFDNNRELPDDFSSSDESIIAYNLGENKFALFNVENDGTARIYSICNSEIIAKVHINPVIN